MFLLVFLVIVINFAALPQSYQAEISGVVVSSGNNKALLNANVSVKSSSSNDEYIKTGTATDTAGKFNLRLPYGSYILTVSYVGFKSSALIVALTEKNNLVQLKIELDPSAIESDEVTVTGQKELPSTVIQQIKPKDLKRMPTLYNDVLRAVQILPGVSTSSELSSGYNVRGGNFDDNLIYLNGFEIYRPFLLRQGVEENKTLINPELVEELRFYNGSFPAVYGDKMSSALEVNYKLNDSDKLNGLAKIDLLNAGLTVKKNFGKLKSALSFRYAYPGLFLNELQTDGDYKPSYQDIQLFAEYSLNEKNHLEVLLLYADNKFDLTPTNWVGHFGGFARGDIRALDIFYNGERNYSFKTGLFGLIYKSEFDENLHFILSSARFNISEDEYSDLYSEYFYRMNAEDESGGEFLKSAQENVSNKLDLVTYEFKPELKYKYDNHLFTAGIDIRLNDLGNVVNESFSETSDSLLSDFPLDRYINEKYNLNSYSAFLQDDINLFSNVFVSAGFRTTYYEFNNEFLFSPRTTLIYIPSEKHSLNISWGYYYQPPYYNELRNKTNAEGKELKAQRSIHYSAGWEYQFKEKVKMNLELYYKKLDNLIPYYVDREKTEYLNKNSNKGFAYGFDLMFQGEIVEGVNSWIGYGYLNTKEKNKRTNEPYHRRLTDQTHTLQVFLQDKIKKHPNWQAHTRLLFGSGHLYNQRSLVTDPETGREYITVAPDKVNEFFIYFRVDMGLSAKFEIDNSRDIIVIAEVMNLFNHLNYGGYRYVQIATNTPSGETLKVFNVPQVLSRRFFNVSLEFRF